IHGSALFLNGGTIADAAGNAAILNFAGAADNASFKVDTAITQPTLALTSDTGSSNSDQITNNGAVTFSALDPDSTRVIKVDGSVVGSYNPASLIDGSPTVHVIDTVTAGNSKNASLSFTFDTTITQAT